jgi:hypothetical protein
MDVPYDEATDILPQLIPVVVREDHVTAPSHTTLSPAHTSPQPALPTPGPLHLPIECSSITGLPPSCQASPQATPPCLPCPHSSHSFLIELVTTWRVPYLLLSSPVRTEPLSVSCLPVSQCLECLAHSRRLLNICCVNGHRKE